MITPSFHPAVGGVETHVRRVSERLAARGYQVTVLTHGDRSSEYTLGPLAVICLPRVSWRRAWQLARPHLAATRIVHCHDAYSYLHFCLPSWLLPPRRPFFITFHGYEGYPVPEEAIRRRAFVRRRVRNAICVGDFVCRWYHTPCFAVTYGGVDPVPVPPPAPRLPSALFLGRLAEDTSIVTYLDALAILKREHARTLPLVVAGDGPLRPFAQRFAEAQRLPVRFLGTVADPRSLFDGADFAFVSGYLAIWQALARRRLVFAVYDNDLKNDYLTGFPDSEQVLNIAPEAATLADQLLAHLTDRELGEEARVRGAALAADHPWDRVADLYLDLYRAHGLLPASEAGSSRPEDGR